MTPHAEDGAYSLWEKIYNVNKYFGSKLVNGNYPEGQLVIGTYGSDISASASDDIRKGKPLPLCSGGSKNRINPTCQAVASHLLVMFQDESCPRKRHYMIRGRVVGGACELPRPTASSRRPSTKAIIHPSTKGAHHPSSKIAVAKAAATATAHSHAHPTKASSKKATEHTTKAAQHPSSEIAVTKAAATATAYSHAHPIKASSTKAIEHTTKHTIKKATKHAPTSGAHQPKKTTTHQG